MPFIIITILIFIHEMGHFLTAKFYNFEIDKIYFYPCGGISKFNLKMNVSLNKELIVLMMGPIFQFMAYIFLKNISFFASYKEMLTGINYSILFFNLLPIYPLDGGKLLNILFNYKFNFQISMKMALGISYLVVLGLFFYFFKSEFSLNIVLMLSFLLYKIRDEGKRRRFYYDKFLLERYLSNYNFKRRKEVSSIEGLYRDRIHLIKGKDRYYTERELLDRKFSRRG